jgi:predicted Zn finger-like uncharacterized protein
MLPLICLESQLLTFSVFVRGHPNRTAPTKVMIVVCPTCATRQDLPQSNLDPEGSLIRCRRCGHSWIESRALSVVEGPGYPASMPRVLERLSHGDVIAERDIRRLAKAARAADAKLAAAQRKRRQDIRGWSLLALCTMVPLAAAALMPDATMRLFPPSARLYAIAGAEINLRGLEFRNVGQQHRTIDGVRVLAIQGEIVNRSGRSRKIPTLVFHLKDERQQQVYAWELNSTTRPIEPGEASSFVTRIASPPENAREVEIGFASQGLSGSNAGP